MNVPRHLPFKIGKIKEAACGGTGNVVLTGEFAFTIVVLCKAVQQVDWNIMEKTSYSMETRKYCLLGGKLEDWETCDLGMYWGSYFQ